MFLNLRTVNVLKLGMWSAIDLHHPFITYLGTREFCKNDSLSCNTVESKFSNVGTT